MYVDEIWVKIRRSEMQYFSEHINSVDKCVNFAREEPQNNKPPFLDMSTRSDLDIEVYRKPTHTDQCLLFDSLHPVDDKLGAIVIHQVKMVQQTQSLKTRIS